LKPLFDSCFLSVEFTHLRFDIWTVLTQIAMASTEDTEAIKQQNQKLQAQIKVLSQRLAEGSFGNAAVLVGFSKSFGI
jgi:hypothetical protein